VRKVIVNYAAILLGLLVFSAFHVYAQPVLQVKPESVDFGEVEPYSTTIATEQSTISNCGTSDSVLCWGIRANDTWLTIEGETRGEINLPNGDPKYVTATVGACGLCVDEVGIYEGSFTVFQYNFNGVDCTDAEDPDADTVDITATMTISEYNILEIVPDELNFGTVSSELTFDIKNTGEGEMEWEAQVSEGADWLTIEGGTSVNGTAIGGSSNTVTLTVDRSKVEGCVNEHSTTVKVTSTNATPDQATVSVTMEKVIEPPLPSSPTPADGSTDQSLYSTIKWQEGSSQGDVGGIVYSDVYFSTNQASVESDSPSVLVCSDLEVPYCDPSMGGGQLEPDTTYYWRVKAVDECENNTVYGDTWSFTTELAENPCLVSTALQLDNNEVNTLRGFRDEVLTKNLKGERYVNLYYSPQAIEALFILFFNPELRVCMNRIVKESIPAIQSLLKGETALVDFEIIEEIEVFLEEFEKEASPNLKKIIGIIRRDIKTGDLFKEFGFSILE
jgi:hypothetical protein